MMPLSISLTASDVDTAHWDSNGVVLGGGLVRNWVEYSPLYFRLCLEGVQGGAFLYFLSYVTVVYLCKA